MEDAVGVKGNGDGGKEHGIRVTGRGGIDGSNGCRGNRKSADVTGGSGYVSIGRGNAVETARDERRTTGNGHLLSISRTGSSGDSVELQLHGDGPLYGGGPLNFTFNHNEEKSGQQCLLILRSLQAPIGRQILGCAPYPYHGGYGYGPVLGPFNVIELFTLVVKLSVYGQRYGHSTDLASAVPYRGQDFSYGLRPYCYGRIRNVPNGQIHSPGTNDVEDASDESNLLKIRNRWSSRIFDLLSLLDIQGKKNHGRPGY
ncbi:hypothetical protein ARMGADRAFT_1027430 [Armillaria gallica]|uniref:Uncharacterized protein n=1 Tax=Armillaria gallica TaxID=47427 RepID=A0A2H3DY09_ARMGA|nr:hypothetical protein ARMGADRAFT_1027430 [Armillaria gallica]